MALSIGAAVGQEIRVGDSVLHVRETNAREIVIDFGGKIFKLSDIRQEIAADVYASRVPDRENSRSPRIAFDAPRTIQIDRLERLPGNGAYAAQTPEALAPSDGPDELEAMLESEDSLLDGASERTNPISSVSERDIDLLLLEEFTVNERFQHWFCEQVFGRPLLRTWKGAWHSVVHTLGESDLIVKFESSDGHSAGILIENKISAAAQPDQGARYYQRGELGVTEKKWNVFKTCLVAPQQYLSSPVQTEEYDSKVPYEALRSFFDKFAQSDQRFSYKSRFISEAIEQNRRGYVQVVSLEMTRFVKFYYSVASARYPELRMETPKDRAPGNTWINFKPLGYPKRVFLFHQTSSGCAKIFFPREGLTEIDLKHRYEKFAPANAEFSLAGRQSLSITLVVPKIDALRKSGEEQLKQIEEGLSAVWSLHQMFESEAQIQAGNVK